MNEFIFNLFIAGLPISSFNFALGCGIVGTLIGTITNYITLKSLTKKERNKEVFNSVPASTMRMLHLVHFIGAACVSTLPLIFIDRTSTNMSITKFITISLYHIGLLFILQQITFTLPTMVILGIDVMSRLDLRCCKDGCERTHNY